MLTIYKASAGSGKTFTLAYEYIKSLLGVKADGSDDYRLNSGRYLPGGHRIPNRHRGILAITFTNAATEEMKTRIVRELSRLSTPEGCASSLYSEWLVKAFGCTVNELREAAAKALSEVLYDYGFFNVSTIDSFFQGVLRTFSREVDHQGDYELELDTELTMKMCVGEMLDRLNYMSSTTPARLVDWIQTFSLDSIRQGKGYNTFSTEGEILRNLTRTMARSLDETYAQYSKALREYMSDGSRLDAFAGALDSRIVQAKAPVREAARAFLTARQRSGLPDAIFNGPALKAAQAAVGGRIIERTKVMDEVGRGEKPLTKLYVEKQRKEAGIGKELVEAVVEKLAAFCEAAVRNEPVAEFYGELRRSLGTLDFFGLTTVRLEEYLRENNTVLISDTGELLKRIISEAEMPFIYERLGMKLETLLIDEFQDTSHMQWHNLRPLVANSLSEGNDSLIIGDEKQAIYRFRNSDSELLGHIVQERDFPKNHRTRGFEPADNTNHRSSRDIVRFNNTVFRRMSRLLDVGSYGNVVQTPKVDLPGYISVRINSDNSRKGAKENTARVLAEMAEEILRQHDEGGYNWRDILILTRERREATAVVEYLTANHPEIAVLSSEALLLSSSSAVRAVMSMLGLVEGSYSQGATRSDGKVAYASNADIVMMITRFNYFCAQGADTESALQSALGDFTGGGIEEEIKTIRAENPANLVALIDAIICHKLSAEQRSSEQAYLTALQDLAVKHTEGPDPSIAAFLKAWQVNADKWAIKASSDLDAVEVMTVHKSKGLERDCVHIPFADWELNHGEQSEWLPLSGLEGFDPDIVPPVLRVSVTKNSVLRDGSVSPFASVFDRNDRLELIDNLNTCYVAFTRAARELCVHTNTANIGKHIVDALICSGDVDNADCLIDTASHYDAAEGVLTIGEPTQRHSGKATSDRQMIAATPYTVVFNEKTRRLTSIDDILSTTLNIGGEADKETVDAPAAGNAEMARAAERGNILHAILATTRTLDRLRDSALRECRRAGLSDAVADEYYRELREAADAGGDLVAGWFAPNCKVYAERAIFVPEADTTFRPDRVVIAPDGGVIVIDYKFTTEARPTHFRQVENYLNLMRTLGYTTVTGYLWYPLLGLIKRV